MQKFDIGQPNARYILTQTLQMFHNNLHWTIALHLKIWNYLRITVDHRFIWRNHKYLLNPRTKNTFCLHDFRNLVQANVACFKLCICANIVLKFCVWLRRWFRYKRPSLLQSFHHSISTFQDSISYRIKFNRIDLNHIQYVVEASSSPNCNCVRLLWADSSTWTWSWAWTWSVRFAIIHNLQHLQSVR